MESVTQVVESQKRKRSSPAMRAKLLAEKKNEPTAKRARQTQPKYKSPLLKIYQETVVSIDQIKDLGAIQHRPQSQGKQLITINFKYRLHEPILIIVNQEELKTVTKRIRESFRKYASASASSTQEGITVDEEDEDETGVSSVRTPDVEMQMQMHENGDLEQIEDGIYTPEPAAIHDKKHKKNAGQMKKTGSSSKSGPTTAGKKPRAVHTEPDEEEDDASKDSDDVSFEDEEDGLHSPEPRV